MGVEQQEDSGIAGVDFSIIEIDDETEVDFSITKIDDETVKISPIKREVEEGLEAILAQEAYWLSGYKTEQTNRKNVRFKLTKLPKVRRKLLEDERAISVQEVEPLFSQSDIQKIMAIEQAGNGLKAKKEEIQAIQKKLDKVEEFSNEKSNKAAVKETETTSSQAGLISDKKVWFAVGVAALTTAIIYLRFEVMAALLFLCGTVCLGMIYNYKFSRSSISEVESILGDSIVDGKILEAIAQNTRR